MVLPSHFLSTLFISSLIILATVVSPLLSYPYTCENELNWRVFMKQVAGSSAGDDNQATVVPTSTPFGTVNVNDWTIIDAPTTNATVIGQAQGVHILSDQANRVWYFSFNLIFQGDRFNGSTLQVMGSTLNMMGVAEWAIVGGTGQLAMARGTIKNKVTDERQSTNFYQLDIRAFYSNNLN
ncbi:unnamed protein product [Urochloa humidicola]